MALTRIRPQISGRAAERAAEQFLTQQGLTLVTRNFRGKRGEIDLIMEHDETLVFVEVRSRRSARFGSAMETIDSVKQAKLIKTAELYLITAASSGRLKTDRPCRFDTVSFDGEICARNLRWIRNAFSA